MLAIDISNAQGSIDFDKVASAGVRLVIVKATEGQGFVDPKFRENWAALLERPTISRAAYHFARVDSDAADPRDAEIEAISFTSALKAAGGADECVCPWLDVEWKGTVDDDPKNLEWIRRFVEVVEAELGRSPGIYTGADVWAAKMAGSFEFGFLPLWQADVTSPAGRPEPMRVPGWSPSMHQHSHVGRLLGIKRDVDLNVIIGGEQTLRALTELRIAGASSGGSVHPVLDLGAMPSAVRSDAVARVQGLLLAQGFGSEGLVDQEGQPDGKPGPKTRRAVEAFRARHRLSPGTVVDGEVWWRLLRVQ